MEKRKAKTIFRFMLRARGVKTTLRKRLFLAQLTHYKFHNDFDVFSQISIDKVVSARQANSIVVICR